MRKTIYQHIIIIIFAFLFIPSTSFAIDNNKYFPTLTADKDGRIETLNNEGGMSPTATGAEVWLLENLKQSANTKANMLEIGPAYGRFTVELFENNFIGNYTAIDISAEHLKYLKESIEHLSNKKQITSKVTTIAGRFPEASQKIKANSFDIIVITHVFHFFKPENFNHALTELYRILKPEGKIYLTAKTPYSNRYRDFIPEYQNRLKHKQKYPGYIDNVGFWVSPDTITADRLEKLYGRHLYFFSKDDLDTIFTKNNFKVLRCEELPLGYVSEIWQAPKGYQNREDVALIATKS